MLNSGCNQQVFQKVLRTFAQKMVAKVPTYVPTTYERTACETIACFDVLSQSNDWMMMHGTLCLRQCCQFLTGVCALSICAMDES